MDALLDRTTMLIGENLWLAPLLSLFAGVLSSLAPCSLSSVPLVVFYVGAGDGGVKRNFLYSAVFALGMAVTFTALGIAASAAGRLMGGSSPVWHVMLGLLMVMMALQMWGIFDFIPSVSLISKNRRRGILGAFAAGVLGGVFSSPCSTPVLIALLTLVAGKGSFAWGLLLMLLYSLGHGALVIAAGTSMGFVRKLSAGSKAAEVVKIAVGLLILSTGLYMFWLAF